MYPNFTNEEVWKISLNILKKSTPLDEEIPRISDFQDVFLKICEKIRHEHTQYKNKYYRTQEKEGIVNPLYVEHYARLMYYFSRQLYLDGVDKLLLDLIFFSIKTTCMVDLFYEFDLKDHFFLVHPYGTVLGRAKYGPYNLIYHNCTIGGSKGFYPEIGEGLVMRAGSSIIGRCKIGSNVHLGAGTLIIDKDIPDNSVVYGRTPNLVVKPNDVIAIEEFFEK
jgi:serine O-acetyltransferase